MPAIDDALRSMTDFEAAEAVRDGVLPSPTQYGDFWLFDLRVTGTGAAYREALDEWAVRAVDEWTSDEFVRRANGLPVVFEHPERSGLDSKEFQERAIGTIVLPYVKADEVWGVAKIYDADAARLMQTTHRSTSPGVLPPKDSSAHTMKDGSDVLVEGPPLVLDHLAVCEAGVWDKDGPPRGIRLDQAANRKDGSVAKTAEEYEKEIEDAKKRADAAEKERDDAKMALDAKRKDESDKEALEVAEREKEKQKADAAKRDSRKDRHAKHDGEIMDCARCDSEEAEEEKERADKAKKDAADKEKIEAERGMHFDSKLSDLQRQNDELRRRLDGFSAEPTIEDRNAIAAAFHRADPVYQMVGDSTPRNIPGESPVAYRRRLAAGLRQYSDKWKGYAIHDSVDTHAFELLEKAIYDDAVTYAKSPAAQKPGVLRMITDTQTLPGKTIRRFEGDPRAAWLPFMPPMVNKLAKFNTAPDRR